MILKRRVNTMKMPVKIFNSAKYIVHHSHCKNFNTNRLVTRTALRMHVEGRCFLNYSKCACSPSSQTLEPLSALFA